MARERMWWRIWRRRDRETQAPIGTSEDPYDVRYWTWGRDNREDVPLPPSGGGLGDLPVRDYGAFSERRPPWLGPSRDARMMRYVPQQRVLLGEVPAVKVQRSDARILEDVCEALRGDEWIDATHIEVDVRDQNVMLTGEVRERNQKWLAEDLVERVLGVRAVVNRIRVGFRELEGPFIKPEKAPMSTEHTEDNGHRTRQ